MLEIKELYSMKKNGDMTLRQMVMDLLYKVDYDMVKLIAFYELGNKANIQYAFFRNEKQLEESENTYIDIYTDSILSLLQQQKKIIFNSFTEDGYYQGKDYLPLDPMAASEIYIPLFDKQDISPQLIGCIYLGTNSHRKRIEFGVLKKEMNQLLIQNIQYLFTLYYHKWTEENRFFGMVRVLFEVLHGKLGYMDAHPYNVAHWASALANHFKLNSLERYKLYIASILHDIGYAYIEGSILNKEEGLCTKEEKELLQKHSNYGYRITKEILSSFPELSEIPEIVKHHHEWYNGSGYPDQIKGSKIPFYSRILCVADAVDIMLSKRHSKKKKSVQKVIGELKDSSGIQFDPEVVDAMIKVLAEFDMDHENVIQEPLSGGTILFTWKEKIKSFHGMIEKKGNVLTFTVDSKETLDSDMLQDLVDVGLYIKKREKIYEYSIRIQSMEENKLLITDYKYKPSPDGFSLLWDLKGIITDGQERSPILINRIGGSELTFSIENEKGYGVNYQTTYIMKLLFGEKSIFVAGRVVHVYTIGSKTLCDYQYTNISNTTRDFIYRQLFQKQMEFRRWIHQEVKD